MEKKLPDEIKEDAPTNSAGTGNIAGIGQPVGSRFGEPGGKSWLLKKILATRKKIREKN